MAGSAAWRRDFKTFTLATGLVYAVSAAPGVAGDLPVSAANDPIAQVWSQAYQKLRQTRRSAEDYKEAIKTVSPALKMSTTPGIPGADRAFGSGSANSAAPVDSAPADPIMDPDKIPRVVTFGRQGDSDAEFQPSQVPRTDGVVEEVEFGGRAHRLGRRTRAGGKLRDPPGKAPYPDFPWSLRAFTDRIRRPRQPRLRRRRVFLLAIASTNKPC